MSKPPKHLVVQLEQHDVQEDVTKVLTAMTRLRAEALADRALSDAQKDEYLHLTMRLASGIDALADEPLRKTMQGIVTTLDRNPQLLQYDPLQDRYWQKREKPFVRALDDVLIAMTRDEFRGTDQKHHVLQALKYLGVADEPFAEKERAYNTILPFHGIIPLDIGQGFLMRSFGRLFGKRYPATNTDALTLRIAGESDGDLEDLVRIAQERGYTKLQVEMDTKEFEENRKKWLGAQIVGKLASQEKRNGFYNALIKYTKPISYPILGSLSEDLRRHLRNTLPAFEPNRDECSFIASILTEVGVSLVLLIAPPLVFGSISYILLGAPFFLDSVGRFFYGVEKNCDPGSALLKPFFYPLEKRLEQKREQHPVLVEIPLRQRARAPQHYESPLSWYERVAGLQLPEDVEKNLHWSTENHHNFSNLFREYVASQFGKMPAGVELRVDREHQAVIYRQRAVDNSYQRDTSLFCLPEQRRYILTTIMPTAEDSETEKNIPERLFPVLLDGEDEKQKLERIGKQLSARYVHLISFSGKEPPHEYEAFS